MERDTLVWCHNISVRVGLDERKSRYRKEKKKLPVKYTPESLSRQILSDL